jgi:type IV secretory pathway VirB3-like protein
MPSAIVPIPYACIIGLIDGNSLASVVAASVTIPVQSVSSTHMVAVWSKACLPIVIVFIVRVIVVEICMIQDQNISTMTATNVDSTFHPQQDVMLWSARPSASYYDIHG